MKKLALLALPLLAVTAAAQTAPFALHDHDTVVFYGDSITDQRLYTLFTEAMVVMRYPKMDIHFVHSGWGGDRVTGGGGGPIDKRLARDVAPYRPSVVTIMLGMNDAGYRAFDQGLFDTYRNGYQHIVSSLKTSLPDVRLTLIQPSPYDDVTRAPGFTGGYNGTLLRYSDAVKDLSVRNRTLLADLNTPVVDMLQKANQANPAEAQKIIPDRVHPGPSGHLIMAEALLKAWNVNGTVSSVAVDGAAGKVTAVSNTKVEGFTKAANGALSWTQTDEALPFAVDFRDGLVALAVRSSDFMEAMNKQTLTVSGLDPAKNYALSIDNGPNPVASVSGAQLAQGVNLAALETPMIAQSRAVFDLLRTRSDVHNLRWRNFQVPFENQKEALREQVAALKAMDKYDAGLAASARKAAQPKAHRFTLTPQ